jgi:hypothetical protein
LITDERGRPDETVDAGAARVDGEAQGKDVRSTGAHDAATGRFWKMLLDPAGRTSPGRRLKAFEALDKMKVLPRCTCNTRVEKLPEFEADANRAYTIRLVGQRHYRAALVIAAFPETYFAVRDAIDAKVRTEQESAGDSPNPTSS